MIDYNLRVEPYISEKNDHVVCDGCGEPLQEGKRILTGIESCCGGGCARVLCEQCVSSV